MSHPKLKIAHVLPTLDPAGGGPPISGSSLAYAQAELGHDVHIFSYKPFHPLPPDRPTTRRLNSSLLNLHLLDRSTKQERILAAGATELFEGTLPHCSVVHIHGVWDPILRAAASAARGAGVPYVIAPRGMLDPWSLAQKRWKKKLALLLGYRTMLNDASFIHALNAEEARLMKPLKLKTAFQIIPNGIFEDDFEPRPERGAFFKFLPALRGRPFILFLGRLHYKKGLDILADAFAVAARRNPDIQLVVAGPDEGERRNFEDAIREVNLSERVHVTGPLYGQRKSAAILDAFCFCLPSRQEGFSMAIAEAMASGTPVVVSRDCHFPEVATEGAGLELPLHALDFANAILELYNDPALRTRMGIAGRNLMFTRFKWSEIAGTTIDLYLKAARARTTTSADNALFPAGQLHRLL